MDTPTATRLFAAARIAYGAGLLVAPVQVGAGWIGGDAQRPATQVALRALGIRDIVLSAGALAFAADADRRRPWLWATVGSDCVDVIATVAAGDALSDRARVGTALLAGSAALAGAALTRSA